MVAPFGGLFDDFVGCAGEEELFCYRSRDICGVGQHGLFVEDLREDVLSAGEVVAEGMPRTVAGPDLSGRVEHERLLGGRAQRVVDLAAAGAGHHEKPVGGGDGQRVSACVGGGGTDLFQAGRVVLRLG